MNARPIPYLNRLHAFRKELHQFPENSGSEDKTASRILEFCSDFHPDMVIEKLGGTGVALVFR
ncbi:MAG: hypothetical protein JXA23_07110, partial [Bacteroidales bacterium]|nr:hypothetical protein [Bacteroidales bacterium]